MFGDGALAFREFVAREPLPLATIHDAVLEFLQGRDDSVLLGAQAVNAYVSESRMTQDVDVASTDPKQLAEELRDYLIGEFHIAIGVRRLRNNLGYCMYQDRKPDYRRFVDVHAVEELPPSQRVKDVQVVIPPELIAIKLVSMVSRKPKSKGFIDQADLYRLLLAFPELKMEDGLVADRLRAVNASESVMAAWKELVSTEILPEDEDEGY